MPDSLAFDGLIWLNGDLLAGDGNARFLILRDKDGLRDRLNGILQEEK